MVRPVLAALAVLVLLAWPSGTAADEAFVPEDRYTPGTIAADGGRFVFLWELAQGGRFTFFEGLGPDAAQLGIPDVDGPTEIGSPHLGTDARGRPVLVYTGCTGGSCRLFRYDFASGRAGRLRVSPGRCASSDGRMLRGVVYFSRERGERCAGGVFAQRPGRRGRRLLETVPPSWDVSRGVLAFERLEVGPSPGDGSGRRAVNEVRVKRLGRGGSRSVAVARYRVLSRGFLQGRAFGGVTLDEGFVHWLRFDDPEGDETAIVDLQRSRAGRRGPVTTLSRSGRSLGEGESGLPGAAEYAVDGDSIYYYSVPVGTRGAIFRVGPSRPHFTR